MKRSYFSLFMTTFLFILLASACEVPGVGGAAPGPDIPATATAEAQQRQHAIETHSAEFMSTAVAQSATETALAVPTVTATVTLTSTPLPTPTVTPGPLVIDDDFSSMNPRWLGCDVCAIKDGALNLGPYPVSNSDKAYMTLCADCGSPHNYKMSVDATYGSGASDRGFGFVLREDNGSYIDLEITTWQVYGVWGYQAKGGDAGVWHSLLPKGFTPTGYLNPSQLTNHIEVEVTASQGGNNLDLLKISFNGVRFNTIEVPFGSGRVGLMVGLHSLGVVFDNFHFEAEP